MAKEIVMQSGFAHRASLSLFGIRVEFESNSQKAIVIAHECISRGNQTLFSNADGQTIYVVLIMYEVNRPRVRGREHIDSTSLHLNFGDVTVRADPRSGHAVCEFPPGGELGESFAEAINTVVMFLVAQAGRIPVHGAAIMLGAVAVVLAGPSGAGKSTLALAAAQAGLEVLSEDTVFVQCHPKLRLWSRTDAIHVFENDAPVDAEGGMRLRSGRWKKVLPLATRRDYADSARLCVLARGDKLSLTPMAPDDAVSALTENPEPGYEFYGARGVEAVRLLAGSGAWRLTLSKSPHEAVGLLRQSFAPAGLG
jgi:hypothetical protein